MQCACISLLSDTYTDQQTAVLMSYRIAKRKHFTR